MAKKIKAGFIPFYFDETLGKFKYMMMVSSDAEFGGDRPMISKGGQDPGETNLQTALREAREELGLMSSNLISCFDLAVEKYKNYKLFVFAGEVENFGDEYFGDFCYETEYTVWMTADEFYDKGREDHHDFVRKLEDYLQKINN